MNAWGNSKCYCLFISNRANFLAVKKNGKGSKFSEPTIRTGDLDYAFFSLGHCYLLE